MSKLVTITIDIMFFKNAVAFLNSRNYQNFTEYFFYFRTHYCQDKPVEKRQAARENENPAEQKRNCLISTTYLKNYGNLFL